MIVIAIIGILAAALFPAMSGYLSRSRDTARISHIGQLITASSTYLQDKSSYSGITLAASPRCVNTGALQVYMNWRTPTDADVSKNHCNVANGNYGAGTGNIDSFTPAVAFSATMENQGNGNTGGTMAILLNYQSGITVNMALIGAFAKNTGTGYVISR